MVKIDMEYHLNPPLSTALTRTCWARHQGDYTTTSSSTTRAGVRGFDRPDLQDGGGAAASRDEAGRG